MKDLPAYLRRVGLEQAPSPTLDGIAELQRAQRLAIPFESFDIRLGRGIALDPDSIFDKLVTRRRGGYCFEQNRLLRAALDSIGIASTPVLARVWLNGSGEVPPLTHMLLHVAIEGAEWIVDAGFGGGYFPPMRLADGECVEGPDGAVHRLVRHLDHGWMLERRHGSELRGGDFQPQYSFVVTRAEDADIALSNQWTATSPSSRFVKHVIASRVTEDGIASLVDRQFSRTGAEGESALVASASELDDLLRRHFDIALAADDIARLGLFA
jgi:N-hydroxyarylamine O-acetyltransferase